MFVVAVGRGFTGREITRIDVRDDLILAVGVHRIGRADFVALVQQHMEGSRIGTDDHLIPEIDVLVVCQLRIRVAKLRRI